MEQYIKKSALEAEIEKIRRIEVTDNDVVYNGALDEIRHHIDTIEAKEIDLGKVFDDEYSKFSNDVDADYGFPIDLTDYKDFAKHFFELGLKAQKGE